MTTTTSNYTDQLREQLSEHRRRLAFASPKAFAQVYLQKHFSLSPSRMHDELFALLEQASRSRSQRMAFAAPRGHAKTTVVSLAYVLWSALYEKETFIVLVSATREQAALLLKAVRDEIETNPLLHTDFPECCYPPGSKRAPKPWRSDMIVLRNRVAVRALGAGQGFRGAKHGKDRPSLIIVDDLEDQEQTASADQREKLRDWFSKTLLKSGTRDTNVIVVGTIMHYDSLLANLVDTRPVKASGWKGRKYQAVEVFSTTTVRLTSSVFDAMIAYSLVSYSR